MVIYVLIINNSIQVAKIMFVISSPFSIVQFMELINVA